MKRLICLAAIAFILTATALNAQPSGKIVTAAIKSHILDTTLKYNVFLPGDFDKSDKLYPIVYLLHGMTDDYTAWKERGLMRIVTNKLLRSEEICEMIIVMPSAGQEEVQNHCCGYFNQTGWRYEDFFFQELMPEVERKYRAIGDREHRAVMGLSMGGGGSVVYCQHHPETFACCFAMSPWLENKMSIVGKAAQKENRFTLLSNSVNANSAIDFLKNADEKTLEKLRTVKWFIDCGDDDFLLEQSLEMYRLMRKSSLKCQLRVRDGRHDWEYWHVSLEMALQFASRTFNNR